MVTFTLHPDGMGTRLHLAHTGFAVMKQMIISFILGGGWKKIVRDGIARAVKGFVDL